MSRARRLAAALALTGALLALTSCASAADPIDPIERLGRKAAERVTPHPPRAGRPAPAPVPSGSASPSPSPTLSASTAPVRPLVRNHGHRPHVLPGASPRHATGS
ncbi:hypothetical protein [Streptomyces sp. NPDC048659]|uniref:hypothetical protein n=1 Tax=Streptomyces sp. NPDC048659 TaxID=3155489 RepID=UPI0034221473